MSVQGTSRSSKATLLSKDAGHAPRALATAFLTALPTGRFGATHASRELALGAMMRYSDTADVLSWDDEEDMDVRSVGSSGRSPVRRFVALANGLQDGQVVLGSAHWIAVVYDVEPRQLRVGGDGDGKRQRVDM